MSFFVLKADESEYALGLCVQIFFFKQKTAYEMRISDWSSDVCSSDLNNLVPRAFNGQHLKLPGASTTIRMRDHQKRVVWRIIASGSTYVAHSEIGRASCRERVCQYV